MDRVILKEDDIVQLLVWRDQHRDLVRSHRTPLNAVKIECPDSKCVIKGFADGPELKLSMNVDGKSKGYVLYRKMSNGMYELLKKRMEASEENVQSVLTVYCSLMALMASSPAQICDGDPVTSRKEHSRNGKAPRKQKHEVTYIIRKAKGTILAAPRGSHASPAGSFTVRGHWRHYKSGKVVWIQQYRKGEGKRTKRTYALGADDLSKID